MALSIVSKYLNDLSKDENIIVQNFIDENNGLVFHQPDFLRVVSDSFNLSCKYILLESDGELFGLCPVFRIQKNNYSVIYSGYPEFEVPYGGWILNGEQYNIQDLMKKIPLRWNDSLIYWSSFLHEAKPDHFKTEKFNTGIIHLEKSENEIWEHVISSSRRNMIRKALKNQIGVVEGGREFLEPFFKIYLESFERNSLRPKPKEFYQAVLNTPGIRSRIFIAYVGNKPVSSIFLLGNQNAIHYWLGVSKKGIGNNGHGELLQWEGIRWALRNKIPYYDLCVIESKRLPNIARFKDDFAENIVPFYCIGRKSLLLKLVLKSGLLFQ